MIKNQTKNKVLAKESILATSFLKKCLGFMFASQQDRGIVFYFNMEKNISFHTFFMRFALDFVFLDEKKRVVKIIHGVKPWRLAVVGKGKYVVELPTPCALDISLGDTISFK